MKKVAVLGGTQSFHTNSMDETLALPTEKSARIALRTQQILANESGVTDTVDPLAGSYYVEHLTNRLEEETLKYAMACSRSRPTDTVAVQKTFLELYKQHKGEYFGSLLTGMVEGMLPMIANDRPNDVDLTAGTFEKGLNNVVKDNDMNFPPEWRLSRAGRNKP